jgi:hypothetical protein
MFFDRFNYHGTLKQDEEQRTAKYPLPGVAEIPMPSYVRHQDTQ